MKLRRFISRAEHKLLLSIAITSFIFSIAGSVAYSIKDSNERNEYYRKQKENEAQGKPVFAGPYCFPDQHPGLLFSIVLLTGATLFSICFAKKYLFSFLLTAATLSRFVFWFNSTQRELVYDSYDLLKVTDRFLYKAGDFDLAVLFLLSFLFFWQISILFRMLIKSLQRKSTLP